MNNDSRKEKIKTELRKRLEKKKEIKRNRKPLDPSPRYDDVYFEGLRCLNQCQGIEE